MDLAEALFLHMVQTAGTPIEQIHAKLKDELKSIDGSDKWPAARRSAYVTGELRSQLGGAAEAAWQIAHMARGQFHMLDEESQRHSGWVPVTVEDIVAMMRLSADPAVRQAAEVLEVNRTRLRGQASVSTPGLFHDLLAGLDVDNAVPQAWLSSKSESERKELVDLALAALARSKDRPRAAAAP